MSSELWALSTIRKISITAFLLAGSLWADGVTIDFESLPAPFYFNSGGQNIGSFYTGLTFGPNVTGLSASRFGGYDNIAFPPHSGDVVIWDSVDPTISVTFNSPVLSFGIWYTSFDPLTLFAFDQNGSLIGGVPAPANTDGTTGTSSYLSFASPGITRVDLTSSPGQYVLDDLTTTSPVPEPKFTFVVGLTLLSLLWGSTTRAAGRSKLRPR